MIVMIKVIAKLMKLKKGVIINKLSSHSFATSRFIFCAKIFNLLITYNVLNNNAMCAQFLWFNLSVYNWH